MPKKLLYLLLISTAVRCLLAYWLEFGNDEVYYWTYARHLQWNYFDHPPMVALLVRLGTLGMHLRGELFVRAGAIACAGLNTWLVFLIGKRLRDERAGWFAALLYNSSFYCSIIAGTFILPDSAQVLWWVLAIYLMTLVTDEKQVAPRKGLLLLLTGTAIGLCIMSKVHGVFLWLGFGLYILLYDRKLLKEPALYAAAAITALIVSPILFWNMQNHFITYSFHNSRVGFLDKKLDWDAFLQQFLGSILYNNPVNVILYALGIWGILRTPDLVQPSFRRLYLLLGLPLILVLLVMSLFNDTLPHWSGPAYISLMLLAAVYYSWRLDSRRLLPGPILAPLLLLGFAATLGVAVIRWLPLQLGKTDQRVLGDGDVTLDMSGWHALQPAFDSVYRRDLRDGRISQDPRILSDKWFPAANLDYYVATPTGLSLFAAGRLVDIHHYAWLNRELPPMQAGSDAYFIYPSNYFGPPKKPLLDYFERMDTAALVPQYRAGVHVRNFVILRLIHYKGGIPADGILEPMP